MIFFLANLDAQRITTWSTFQNVFSLVVRVITTGLLAAAVIMLAVHEPNLRAWSCENKYLESDINNNTIGFEQTCLELVSTFKAVYDFSRTNTDSQQSATLAAGIFNALLEGFSIAEAVYYMKFKGRKLKGSVSGSFPRQLKIYERIDPAAREQDEVPMLNVDRKSRDFDRSAPVENEPEDEWNASMLEVGRGSMQ